VVIFCLALFLATGNLSDSDVNASEGDGVVELPGPNHKKVEPARAQVVMGGVQDTLQVTRASNPQAGTVTVVTGFECQREGTACSLLAEGAFTEAATLFRNRIASGDVSLPIRCGLANSLYLEGDLLGAARVYTWAASGFPHHPDVHNGLGNVFVELDQFQRAIEEFSDLADQPGYAAVAHNNLGNVYRKMDRLEEALNEYREALVRDPRLMAAHYNRAGTLMKMGQFAEAADSFRQASHLARGFAGAYLYEGLARMKSDKPVLAATALYRAAELGADGPVFQLALGLSLQEVGLDADAVKHLQAAVEGDPQDRNAYQLLSVSLVRVGKLEQAAEVLEQAFALGPQDADAHFFLGLKLFLCEQPATAAKHFMQAAAKGRRQADTFFALGQALLQSGEVDSSIKSLNLAVHMNPVAPEIHFALGIAHFHNQDIPSAVHELQTAAALDPDDQDTLLVLMDFLRRAGRFSDCAETGKAVVDKHPDLVTPRFETAFCLSLAGRFALAQESMEDALDHDVEGSEVLSMWKTLSELTRSQAVLPGPHLLLALIHERRGNWSEAIRAYERFILVSPSQTWSRKALERIHSLQPRDPAGRPAIPDGN